MPEWWTYTFSDFLLFSPRTYYRLIERHNEAIWPGQVVTIGLGLVIAVLVRRPAPRQGRLVSTVLAALWTWVAWAFLWQRYAAINWAVTYLVWLFAIEVLLLVWIGVVRGGLSFRWRRDAEGAAGIALFFLSLTLYPVFAPLLGRGWRQAEIFGVAPDPTVLATLGLLLLAKEAPRWELLAAPLLWCLVSGATLWAMGSPEAWVLISAALLTVGASGVRGRREP
jgi:hypothetical protein